MTDPRTAIFFEKDGTAQSQWIMGHPQQDMIPWILSTSLKEELEKQGIEIGEIEIRVRPKSEPGLKFERALAEMRAWRERYARENHQERKSFPIPELDRESDLLDDISSPPGWSR